MAYEFQHRPPPGGGQGSCADDPDPAALCYGFVFEDEPRIKVEFTDDLDRNLLARVVEASPEELEAMHQQFVFNAQRAGGDPWIGKAEEWEVRSRIVEGELRRRGLKK